MESTNRFDSRIRYEADGNGAGELILADPSYGPQGRGADIRYIITGSPYGRMLIAVTRSGVCWLSVGGEDSHMESELRRDYPEASIERDQHGGPFTSRILDYLGDGSSGIELPVDIRATPFQAAVWRQLCAIPRGATLSYAEIAKRIRRPDAPRAVGHAVGSNPISIFIPCHRAIGTNGSLTGYRWGLSVKRKLLLDEGANLAALKDGADQAALNLAIHP
jgi:AraC family transcriptional regulator of adaptative response/methylated-DNA-[protein]-cysteine methyltransferase